MMKARLIAAALGAALFAFADKAPAGLIIFTGVIDEVRFSGNAAPFTVGDPFSATFFFAGQPPIHLSVTTERSGHSKCRLVTFPLQHSAEAGL